VREDPAVSGHVADVLGDVGCGVLRAPLTRSACPIELLCYTLCSGLCCAAGIIGTHLCLRVPLSHALLEGGGEVLDPHRNPL